MSRFYSNIMVWHSNMHTCTQYKICRYHSNWQKMLTLKQLKTPQTLQWISHLLFRMLFLILKHIVIYFPNANKTFSSLDDKIDVKFTSKLLSRLGCRILLSSIDLCLEKVGHSKRKWFSSSTTLFGQHGQILASIGILGLLCLPFSTMRSWLLSLSLLIAFLSLTPHITKR